MKRLRWIAIVLAAMSPMAFSFGPGVLSGPQTGAPPQVILTDTFGNQIYSFLAFGSTFAGGVSVAKGDVNLDGVPDMIVGAGPGGGPQVSVFNGADGNLASSFFAFDAGFSGGVNVGVGDYNGDGRNDIVAGPGAGGSPVVRVFDGGTNDLLASFFAYSPTFTGGVFVAAGDFDGDGRDDIATGQGPGAGPQVNVFQGGTGQFVRGFFAYGAAFNGGVNVAAGDVNGDGREDIITAPITGAQQVCVFIAPNMAFRNAFDPYGTGFTPGINVASGDLNGDGADDIITGAGPGGGPHVRMFDGTDTAPLVPHELVPFGLGHTTGIRVGTGQLKVDSFFDVFYEISLPGAGPLKTEFVLTGSTGDVVERDFRILNVGTPTRVWFEHGFDNFDIYVKGVNTLGQVVPNVALNGGGTIPTEPLVLGDIDGNDTINVNDFIHLRNAFGSSAGDAAFDPLADLNGDGSVNVADFIIFRQGFGESGPGRP